MVRIIDHCHSIWVVNLALDMGGKSSLTPTRRTQNVLRDEGCSERGFTVQISCSQTVVHTAILNSLNFEEIYQQR